MRPNSGDLVADPESEDDFDYDLPPEAIALEPVEPRDSARLMVVGGAADPGAPLTFDHRHVSDLAELVGPGDLLVVNDTRVLRARLEMVKATGGAVEVLLLAKGTDGWDALVRPGRRVPPGTRLTPARPASGPGAGLVVEVGEDRGGGMRGVRLDGVEDEAAAIEDVGSMPVPPYLNGPPEDPERYQTVYARHDARSVAAPTAGLHFTEDLLGRCVEAGAKVATVELEVGIGTFRPIMSERIADHRMHAERYHVPEETLAACRDADRVIAVGTTAVRALEAAVTSGRPDGSTELFLRPGGRFAVVDALVTNYHLPRSSLLALVSLALGGRWRDCYAEALAEGYRFLSFGDAMFIPQVAGRTPPVESAGEVGTP